MREYEPKEIEQKWQRKWEEEKAFEAKDPSPFPILGKKPKWYSLIEFPYPSGDGLHVGHVRSYTALDIVSRKRRMQGYNVLYPIGWDAFGLPTENYAIKTGRQPAEITKENTDNFRKQMKSLGLSFDWSREVNTTDPKYYKWTQWIFLKFFEKGLAYKAKTEVNWCPKDKIVLANEEVVDGRCERCGTVVEKREKEQWMLAITKYAERLLKDLDDVDYPESVKAQQRNWIGRSEGALVKFDDIEVFTTRPDTIFGATFIVKAGKEDRFTGQYVTNPATKEKIPVWESEYVMADYGTGAIMGVPAHDERDYEFARKHVLPLKEVIEPLVRKIGGKDGFRTDVPVKERRAVVSIIKHWSEDKYLGVDWGTTGWRGFSIGGIEEGESAADAGLREIVEETGYKNPEIMKVIPGKIHAQFFQTEKNVNRFAHFEPVLYKLKDGDMANVAEEERKLHRLFWLTPEEMESFITNPDMRLAWNRSRGNNLYAAAGSTEGGKFEEIGFLMNSGEFDGMPIDEARLKIAEKFGKKVTRYKLRDWIFSRQRYWGEPIPIIHCEKCGYVAVPEKDLPVELPKIDKYQPTDTGESPLANVEEWVNIKCPKCSGEAKRETDVMPNWAGSSWYFYRYTDPKNDQEFASKSKLKHWMPIDWYNGGMEHTTLHLLYSRFWNKFLFDLGLVPTSEPYKKRTSQGVILAPQGDKMSKSKGNVVNPDSIIDRFGADTLRLYEMFMGPFEQAIQWNDDALVGPRRFLERVWRLQDKLGGVSDEQAMHSTIKKVSEDIESMGFNTAVSAMMVWANLLEKKEKISMEEFQNFLLVLSPFAPHITEELWEILGHRSSLQKEIWPKYDESKLIRDEITVAIQVNGKVRASLTVPKEISKDELEKLTKDLPEVSKWLENREVKKVIIVPGKIINFVVS
ncbi:class I tRNA ligase family protein [Candidatus Parcubacteria bacterium]|nr:class I tRNA ligase family protein [Candidatus Parcubacteria bacterium]